MTTLGIDTSTSFGTIGLISGSELIGEFTFHAKESQSERLLPTLDLLIKETNTELSQLDKVAVSTGPGSFTGLRIGISTAKGLAHGLGIPVVGVPLTDCYYSRVSNYNGPVCTVIKDRRNLVYYAVFNGNGDKILTEESTSIEDLGAKLMKKFDNYNLGRSVLLVGDGLTQNLERFKEFENVTFTEGSSLNYPSGAQVGFLGEKMDEDLNQLTTIEPLYAQRPIAELNWATNNKDDSNG